VIGPRGRRARRTLSTRGLFFRVEQLGESGCGLKSGTLWLAGGQRVSPHTRVVGWATAQWFVQAQALSQQEDQCAQSRLFDKPLELDQSLEQC
jgi:hypothetical protein